MRKSNLIKFSSAFLHTRLSLEIIKAFPNSECAAVVAGGSLIRDKRFDKLVQFVSKMKPHFWGQVRGKKIPGNFSVGSKEFQHTNSHFVFGYPLIDFFIKFKQYVFG